MSFSYNMNCQQQPVFRATYFSFVVNGAESFTFWQINNDQSILISEAGIIANNVQSSDHSKKSSLEIMQSESPEVTVDGYPAQSHL